MANGCRWSERELDGFVLALLVHSATERKGSIPALAVSTAERVRTRRATLAALGPRERRRWVRETLAATPTPATDQGARPPRALSLLSPHVERELGRRWLASSPLPRAGYVPPPGLLRLLRRLASEPAPPASGEA